MPPPPGRIRGDPSPSRARPRTTPVGRDGAPPGGRAGPPAPAESRFAAATWPGSRTAKGSGSLSILIVAAAGTQPAREGRKSRHPSRNAPLPRVCLPQRYHTASRHRLPERAGTGWCRDEGPRREVTTCRHEANRFLAATQAQAAAKKSIAAATQPRVAAARPVGAATKSFIAAGSLESRRKGDRCRDDRFRRGSKTHSRGAKPVVAAIKLIGAAAKLIIAASMASIAAKCLESRRESPLLPRR